MGNPSQNYLNLLANPLVIFLLMTWTLFWKGLALWKASQKRQLVWFLVLLIFNTLGVLEIAYIFYLNRFDPDKGRLLDFLKKFRKKE